MAKGKQRKIESTEGTKVIEVHRDQGSTRHTAVLQNTQLRNSSTKLGKAVEQVITRAIREEALQPGEAYVIVRMPVKGRGGF